MPSSIPNLPIPRWQIPLPASSSRVTSRTARPAAPAWLLWSRLAWTAWEAFAFAGPVIAARTARMLQAGAQPGSRDRREFVRMGSEKLQAASESAWAMASHWQALNTRLALQAWRPWADLANLASAGWRWPGTPMARPGYAAQRRAESLSGDLARLALSGLAPVHRTVRANAKRLGAKRLGTKPPGAGRPRS